VRLSLVGVSHRRAPVELRERVALDRDGSAELARRLADGGEAVVLSTCNPTER
jgi:glutamyl-tRNA reductase